MSGSSSCLAAHTTAHRVWSIPHIRLAIFQSLLSNDNFQLSDLDLDQDGLLESLKRNSLKPYLTLDQASLREVAFLLYRDIRLDQFPWDCACEASCYQNLY